MRSGPADRPSKTLESAPKDATHWSTRSMAKEVGLSQTAVSQIWRAFGLQPHRQDAWKLSQDPWFIEKVRDVVGLYMNPPERASCCVSMRSHRSKRCTGPRRSCRCCLARRSARRIIHSPWHLQPLCRSRSLDSQGDPPVALTSSRDLVLEVPDLPSIFEVPDELDVHLLLYYSSTHLHTSSRPHFQSSDRPGSRRARDPSVPAVPRPPA